MTHFVLLQHHTLAEISIHSDMSSFPFRLNYSLCSGRSRCFHATNVFLHAAATALVAAVCRRVLAARPGFAAAAASLFALHPVHTEAVSSRRDSQ